MVAGDGTLSDLVMRNTGHRDLETHLDGLDGERRIIEVCRMTADDQATLWQRVKGKGALDLASFVGRVGEAVIYQGKNSLPVFSRFQKRFYQAAPGAEVAGYNHNGGFVSFFTGPGYFVTTQKDGELVFDYTRAPSAAPPEWPAIATNSGPIAGLVFGGMVDYVRFVSKDTVIGAAYKGGKSRNQYFMLTRA